MLFLPEGEHHELGLLFANYLIRSSGHRTLYLGQSMPISDLESVRTKFKPDVIFTSATAGTPLLQTDTFIGQLVEKFPESKILLTGRYFVETDAVHPDSVGIIRHPEDLRRFLV